LLSCFQDESPTMRKQLAKILKTLQQILTKLHELVDLQKAQNEMIRAAIAKENGDGWKLGRQ
jgi:hypothetical protein